VPPHTPFFLNPPTGFSHNHATGSERRGKGRKSVTSMPRLENEGCGLLPLASQQRDANMMCGHGASAEALQACIVDGGARQTRRE